MQQLDEDLWVCDAPLRFFGLEVGTRMTVVRLPGGGVLLHSPTEATAELVRAVEALGPVEHLVAPNKLHHLFIEGWRRACPDARLHLAPGLSDKRPDLTGAQTLGDGPDPAWADVLDQTFVAGFPFSSEVVFFHRPSTTLVATDLAFHIGPTSPLPTRLFFKLGRTYGRLAPTLLERLLIRDRVAIRRSLERVLDWPFERVVVAHGDVCESGGRAQLVESYGWALRA